MAVAELTQDQKTRIEEILRILDQNPASAELENRRQSVRVKVRTNLTTRVLSTPGHPTLPIHTRNISTSGIGFVTRRPFRKGELVAIELYLVSKLSKLILAETTFSRYVRDGLYEVGCRFREAISREEAERGMEGIPRRWVEAAMPGRHH